VLYLDKQIFNFTLFLLKDYLEDFENCLKNPRSLISASIKSQYGLDGKIYFAESKSKPPRWKVYLEELSTERINIDDNASNKALMLVKVNTRIMAIVFGYGRAFLKEECIERNFGFKVALNTIDPKKMRSVNAATIEDMVVNTQRQASYSTSQDEFGLNITNDIMKGVTGEPYDKNYGNHISGKDSLVVSIFMELSELKDKLTLYLDAFRKDRYKNIGFEWVDNVSEVRDSLLSEKLDFELTNAIETKQINHLHIAPPETTDWERIIGFCFSGIGKKSEDRESYVLNIDLSEYIDKVHPGTNIYQKIKRDRLLAMTVDEVVFPISSIYSSLVFQTEFEGSTYILCSGNWYEINASFYCTVHDFVRRRVPSASFSMPDCPNNMKEEEYNQFVVDGNTGYCLMDQKLISVEGGPKKIEACDIFTVNKQLIHVKNKGRSSQLSHLFSQGKVSAQCFISDENYRKQVSDIAEQKYGRVIFNYHDKPQSNEYEVVFAIIDDKITSINEKLPFFSLVNLMLTVIELERMHFKYSVCLVERQ
jgi:hypothetical protein